MKRNDVMKSTTDLKSACLEPRVGAQDGRCSGKAGKHTKGVAAGNLSFQE